MKHFVVYHNPDSIGYPASEVSDLSIVTNKSITDEILGNKIWLITGEGQPRNYSIVAQFIANTVESGKSDGFTTRVKGHLGTIYKQMKSIDHCTWLPDFKRIMGNFAFGIQRITDETFVNGLEEASKDSHNQAL